jgi:hypothetical protein
MARLLQLGSPRELPADDGLHHEVASEILTELLASPIDVPRGLAGAAAGLSRGPMPPGDATTLGELVLDGRAAPPMMAWAKRAAKCRAEWESSRRPGSPDHDAALAAYYLVIAAAILHCGEKISSYSHEQLARTFRKIGARRWVTPPCRQLLYRAAEACDARQHLDALS